MWNATLSLLFSFVAIKKTVEPTIGIEPMNLFLTKEALYRLSYVGTPNKMCQLKIPNLLENQIKLERETRLELATFSLEG